MLFFRWTTLLAVNLLSLASCVLSQEFGNCTGFNWDQQPLYLTNDEPRRISGAEVCADSARNGTCLVTAEGDELFSATRNITNLVTFIPGSNMDIFTDSVNAAVADALVAAGLETTAFNDTVIAPIDQTRSLSPGQAAYLNFTAVLFCFTGTTKDCSGSVRNETPIEVCAPLWRQTSSSSRRTIDGEYTLVYIDANDADNFSDPYANQANPDEGAAAVIGMSAIVWGLVSVVTIILAV